MTIGIDPLRASINAYCAEIGADPLLVQGAGGNVSWKSKDTLWVKASGTWLADATENDIFIPVDLITLREAINQGNFSVVPTVKGESTLKPSIETLLHALMPYPIVVHLHAVEVLAHLVRLHCEDGLNLLSREVLPWAIVDYFKPGGQLAAAVNDALRRGSFIKVVFLKNHGVVIGGYSIHEIDGTMKRLISDLTNKKAHDPVFTSQTSPLDEYKPVNDETLHLLAQDPELFERLQSSWALYPDHIVFLGPRAHCYNSWADFSNARSSTGDLPELVFIRGTGVFTTANFSKAKVAQLRCYYDVLRRQTKDTHLTTLSSHQTSELLNWDAEKHRISLQN